MLCYKQLRNCCGTNFFIYILPASCKETRMKIFENVLAGVAVLSVVLGLTGPMAALAAGPAAVNLGTAGNFVILTKSGISTTGVTAITGDIGVSPIAASAITGFGLTMDVLNTFSTAALVTGKVYASDYTTPTPATMTTAVSDMQTAYTDAAGRTLPTATELGAGNIGGMTLAPGLYKWGTGVTIPTDVTLSGGANDVWIFQIAQNLTVSSAAHVILSGGAKAANIFWQVAGQTTLGTTSVFNGNILDQTSIVLETGAQLNGRALAQTAVTLDSNVVTVPAYVAPTPTPTPTPTSTSTTTPTPTSTPSSSTVPSPFSAPAVDSSLLQNLQNMGIAVHSLVKLADDGNANTQADSAVYYVGADGKRHSFANSHIFFSWFTDFNGVRVITLQQLANLPLGINVRYKPGSKMVKFTTDPKVYVVSRGGVLRWVKTEGVAAALYGSLWNKGIDDLSDALRNSYTFGADVNNASDFNLSLQESSVGNISADYGL
ncbi:MAG: ice-binding family protein [Patescibacteria group bacterium]|jgi:hypothetical protein